MTRRTTTRRSASINVTSFPPSIAHACAELPSDQYRSSCKRTVITSGGKHPCMETVGARVNAGLACCLLNCVFDGNLTSMVPSSGPQEVGIATQIAIEGSCLSRQLTNPCFRDRNNHMGRYFIDSSQLTNSHDLTPSTCMHAVYVCIVR